MFKIQEKAISECPFNFKVQRLAAMIIPISPSSTLLLIISRLLDFSFQYDHTTVEKS